MLGKAEVALPQECARQVALLIEGAAALILIHGDRSYAETASRAAKQLIAGAVRATPTVDADRKRV